jgi:hypothetical protein
MRRAASPGGRPPCWQAIEEKTKGAVKVQVYRRPARDAPGAGRGRAPARCNPPQHDGRDRIAVRAVRGPGHPLHVPGRGSPDAGGRSQFASHEDAGRGALEGARCPRVLHVLLRDAATYGGSAGAGPQGPAGREDPRHPVPHLHGGGGGMGAAATLVDWAEVPRPWRPRW